MDLDELGVAWGPDVLWDLVELSRELWYEVSERARSLCSHELYGFRFSKAIFLRPPKYYGILIFGVPRGLFSTGRPRAPGPQRT